MKRFNAPLGRRDFIKFGGTALLLSPAALGVLTGASPARAASVPRSLWIYDAELWESGMHPLSGNVIDIAEQRKTAWKSLRSIGGRSEGSSEKNSAEISGEFDVVDGSSRWSDLLIIRGHLESCGMRMVTLQQADSVFQWRFVNRSLLNVIS